MMVKTVIVTSEKDLASMNIREKLLMICEWEGSNLTFDGDKILRCENQKDLFLVKIKNDVIYSDYLNQLPLKDVTRIIFASRHSSETKKPSLHVHFTGNWGDANPYGGKPRSLSIAEPIAAKKALLKLVERHVEIRDEKFSVSLEVTHHGPTEIDYPMLFVELGSSESQWKNEKAAEILAEIILEIANEPIKQVDVAIGFGGPHYAPAFTKLTLEHDIYMSHMVPKYFIDEFNTEMLNKMIKRSSIRPKIAALDWKGMNSKQRKKIQDLLDQTDLEKMKI